MPETDALTAARAEAIASQVVDLKETEVLVLRLPEDMGTPDEVFKEFRRELSRLLPEGVGKVRVIVLRHDMKLESFGAKALAKVGLSTRNSPPGKSPESLFESGPLRAAAQAAWASAFGDNELAESMAHGAVEGLRVERATADQFKITHSSPPTKPRGNGGPI